jgi:hypothetical protein
VLDRSDAGLDGVANGEVRVGVGEDVLAHRPRLLHRRPHLGHRVLRGVELVGGRHGAPEAMILIWSTSWRSCSRTALRTSASPSAIDPTMPRQQRIGSTHSERRRLSPCPPVWEM